MESEQKSEYTESISPKEEAQKVQKPKVEVRVDQPGAITQLPPPEPSTDEPWQEWVQPVVEFVSKLPDYAAVFFEKYQRPLIIIALLLSGVVTVKVTLAILDAINGVPLLAPIFELVGIGYTGWFVWRYLLKVETRQELAVEFEALKKQVVGKESHNS
ncbi:CAAD domain-containing protein [Lyngbya aestuarii]|uniref:CAAD domain-containing protein n=1 Tax=Lyngbya aestuarii TaxID=118322 RepID=UPI00403E30AC